MKRLSIFLALVAFILVGESKAQDFQSLVAEGDRFYKNKNYQYSIDNYLQALRINPDDASVNFKTGLAYLYSQSKSKAAQYIIASWELNPDVDPQIHYYLGLAFQNTNEFRKAIEHFRLFGNTQKNYAAVANKKIAECAIADSLSRYELNVVIENMGSGINTPYHDYSPIISADGNTLIFTSNRLDGSSSDGKTYEDIYVTTRSGNKWSAPRKISSNINQQFNDAAASLSPDGKTLFIYYEQGNGDIFMSRYENGDWTKPIPMNSNINSPEHWETSATLSADGKKLYFASNRPGGFGQLDLYVSVLDSNGQWAKAFNLGPVVNTAGSEDAPFLHPDGATLYFSSNGHPTLGNHDIFVCDLKDGKWQKPRNLGWPVNTWEYDGFFTISADKTQGYFSTMKEGGIGNTDIYSIKFLEPMFKNATRPTALKQTKVNAPTPATEQQKPVITPVSQVTSTVKIKGRVSDNKTEAALNATVTLTDNATGKVIAEITADPAEGRFELVANSGTYTLAAHKEDYLFNSKIVEAAAAQNPEVNIHIYLARSEVGSKMIRKNIFFDIAKAELKDESRAELDRIREFLHQNPKLRVQINGHTDNRGKADANKALSLQRATSVVNYLVSKGIDKSRLAAKGFGSERPIVSNDDENGGREINRRTEIEIIGIDD